MNIRFLEMLRKAPLGEEGQEQHVEVTAQEGQEQVEGQEARQEAQEKEEPKPAVIPVDVFQKRIAAMTKRQKDLERENEILRLGKQMEVPDEEKPAKVIEAEVNKRAAAFAMEMDFNRRSQAVANAGQKMSPDFLVKINEMNLTHGTLTPTFIEAVMEAGETEKGAAELLYDLANDAVKAAEILGMSPTKQAIALAKLQGEKVSKKAAPTPKAKEPPAPIKPKIGAGSAAADGPVDLYDKKTPIDKWMEQRDKEARASRKW